MKIINARFFPSSYAHAIVLSVVQIFSKIFYDSSDKGLIFRLDLWFAVCENTPNIPLISITSIEKLSPKMVQYEK